ncbi:MAG: Synerg-CTERM sorting domain-containing protein [Synergistales bacterium]
MSDSVDYDPWLGAAWEEEDDSSSGCSAGILNPMFLLLLAPLDLLLRKTR